MQHIRTKIPLKKLISENFAKESKKIFYSFEVTPKWNYELDLPKLSPNPLFVGITWISDQNLKYETINKSPAMRLKRNLENHVNVVNTLSCFKLEDRHLDDLLSEANGLRNLTVLRGDGSDTTQKYKYANELIQEIRKRTEKYQDEFTIFAAGIPSISPEPEKLAADMKNLKEKVDCGVDVLLTQLILCPDVFCDYVKTCRSYDINVPIIPGIYIPANPKDLEFLSKISKTALPKKLEEEFSEVADNEEKFQDIGLKFTIDLMREIQEKSPEHVPCYHFFTMNNLEMLKKLTQIVKFAEP